MFTGDLRENGGSGLEGGDAKCQAFANREGLGGTWKAWLGTSSLAPRERFSGAWYDVDGRLVLISDGTTNPNNHFGVKSIGGSAAGLVWTGSTDTGGTSTHTCENWSNGTPDASGNAGSAGATDGGGWTGYSKRPCDIRLPIYCFEQ